MLLFIQDTFLFCFVETVRRIAVVRNREHGLKDMRFISENLVKCIAIFNSALS